MAGVPPMARAMRSEGLPAGWCEGIDPAYQRPFYYNKRTRRSTWTKPDEAGGAPVLAGAGAASGSASGDSEGAGMSEGGAPMAIPVMPEGAASPSGVFARAGDKHNSPSSSSGSGKKVRRVWLEVFSPEHNRNYYFNRETKESSWVRPSDEEMKRVYVRKPRTGPSAKSTASAGMIQPDIPEGAPLFERAGAVRATPVEVPALQAAWKEIEKARLELQREREAHTTQLRSEWKVLQTQIQQLRELSLNASFKSTTAPNDAAATPGMAAQVTAAASASFANEVAAAGTAPVSGEALPPPPPPPPPGPGSGSSGPPGSLLAGSAEHNANAAPGTGMAESPAEPSANAFTAGLLSELEDYADSLMKRRESIHTFNSSLHGPHGGGAAAATRAREESRRRRAARKARMGSDASDSDGSSVEFDKDEYIEHLLGGLQEAVPTQRGKAAEDVDTLIPLAIEAEIADVDAQMRAVKAEADAVSKAQEEFRNLKEGCFYKLLGVGPSATPVELKKAYHKSMMKWHPDKYQGEEREEANKMTSQLGAAYQVLSDKWERTLYDIMGVEQYLVHANVIQCFINYLVTGCRVKKHPRRKYGPWRFIDRQFVKRRTFWLSTDHKHLNVARKRNLEPTPADLEHIKQIDISEIKDIIKGMKTEVLERSGALRREPRYLSIITNERTLDLEAPDNKQREFLHSRLTLLVIQLQKNKKWFEKFHEERNPKKKRGRRKRSKHRNMSRPPPPPPSGPPPRRSSSHRSSSSHARKVKFDTESDVPHDTNDDGKE